MSDKVYIYEESSELFKATDIKIKRLAFELSILSILYVMFGAENALKVYFVLLALIIIVNLYKMSKLIILNKEADNE